MKHANGGGGKGKAQTGGQTKYQNSGVNIKHEQEEGGGTNETHNQNYKLRQIEGQRDRQTDVLKEIFFI